MTANLLASGRATPSAPPAEPLFPHPVRHPGSGLHTRHGRFAPSPTGALHFGSLIAAVGSFAEARHPAAGGPGSWQVRIDDLDRTREVPGAAAAILQTLEAFGLHWDGAVYYQSHRGGAYADALAQLRTRGLTYPCCCSRREIAARGRPGPEGPLYPGTCRNGLVSERHPRSERLRVPPISIRIEDAVQGPLTQHLASAVGDFVLRRADGLYAYQLAVVVDDAAQGIDQVVRGADLLASTPRQAYLQHLLGLPRPRYAHLPIALDPAGRKLSKSLAAVPVDPANPLPALLLAWTFLGQPPLPQPPADVAEFWALALPRWSLAAVPHGQKQPLLSV
ncbi:MAG: tRNA glutamyl-Q(34) synthetase GluQRS [Chromatiaceae bacterium]|nr:MAG: tRNA glutamyl-Q(34) synthetase GluQRS [Chromatiaceae bacterium]